MKVLGLLIAVLALNLTSAQAADVNTTTELLAKTIKDAGAVSSVNNNLRVDLVKGEATIEECDAGAKLTVTKIDFDTKTGDFSAYISANNNLPFEVAGHFAETIKVPTLVHKFDKNEIIAKNDITYIEIEAAKLRDGYILREDKLIGKAPTHTIFKERPIAINQIAEAQVVAKNKQMTMIYKNNSLTIKATGVALENGAVGQSVKIKNTASNRVVVARIIDERTAEVQAGNELASN